jgi:hypothetical protein
MEWATRGRRRFVAHFSDFFIGRQGLRCVSRPISKRFDHRPSLLELVCKLIPSLASGRWEPLTSLPYQGGAQEVDSHFCIDFVCYA